MKDSVPKFLFNKLSSQESFIPHSYALSPRQYAQISPLVQNRRRVGTQKS
eukprot:IDg19150t1